MENKSLKKIGKLERELEKKLRELRARDDEESKEESECTSNK